MKTLFPMYTDCFFLSFFAVSWSGISACVKGNCEIQESGQM